MRRWRAVAVVASAWLLTVAEVRAEPAFLPHAEPTQMLTDDLLGLAVVDGDAAELGRIGGLVVERDGRIVAVMIDFGRFLGFGGRTVAVPWDELRFVTGAGGRLAVAVVAFGQAYLDAAPDFGGRAPMATP